MTTVDTHRTTYAAVFGEHGDPWLVLCDPEGDAPGHRFFTIVLDDTPGPDGEPNSPVCVHCLIELHPTLGRGLDVALEHRGARFADGEWEPAPELWDE